jgi:hypothetical protein
VAIVGSGGTAQLVPIQVAVLYGAPDCVLNTLRAAIALAIKVKKAKTNDESWTSEVDVNTQKCF